MGVCQSQLTPEQQKAKDVSATQTKKIDQQLRADHSADANKNKLLLLGAGESGKSTLFKQMINLYKKGVEEKDLVDAGPLISSNIIATTRALCDEQHSGRFGQLSCTASRDYVLSQPDDKIDAELGGHLKTIWADPVIQETFKNRNVYNIQLKAADSISYFFERLDDIMKDDYVPTQQDYLRVRVPTTGIIKTAFEIDGNSFEMFDVGGQRSERKKWINCFDNVTAVLFVAAISEFDQMLYEEATHNRMKEALELFETTCNLQYFDRTSMILFLNKRDIFINKIESGVRLSDTFSEFTGDNSSVKETSEFIIEMFNSRNADMEKDIYTHITTATDTNNVFTVFSAVKDIIIKRGLMRAGLV